MRGRTNIPPRVGGIVKGDIQEYVVAKGYQIGVGDYVETTNNGAVVYQELGSSYMRPSEIYQMEDGTYVVFTLDSGTFSTCVRAHRFQVDANGITPLGSIAVDLSQIVPHLGVGADATTPSTRMYFNVLQMSGNVFLFWCATYDTVQKRTVIEVKWNGSTFTTKALYSVATDGTRSIVANTNDFFKWDDSHFVMVYLNGTVWDLVVMNYSDGVASVMDTVNNVGINVRNTLSLEGAANIFRTGNTILVQTYNRLVQLRRYNVDVVSGDITVDTMLEVSVWGVPYNWQQIDETRFLVARSDGVKTVKGNVLSYNDGIITMSEEQTFVTNMINDGMSEFSYTKFAATLLDNDRVLFLDKTKKNALYWVGVVNWDAVLGTADELTLYNLDMRGSESGAFPNIPIATNKKFFFDGKRKMLMLTYKVDEDPPSNNYLNIESVRAITLWMFNLDQDIVMPFEKVLQVKKYQRRISGVAKTAGTAGEVVQVYVPPVEEGS